jgi:2-oxoglutarate dehydrogenase E2 component (dihydrolipoamide succinyltransferase)
MPTDVVMPQLGESVAEGTIVRWIKKVGDEVACDEPLCEISTDKVDAEIPSPAAGTVAEIRVAEGGTVPVNSIVAVIGHPEEAQAGAMPAETVAVPTPVPTVPREPVTPRPVAPTVTEEAPRPEGTAAPAGRQRLSPLVRKIAKDHNVDVSQVHGTGAGGRVTKRDILDFLAASKAIGETIQPMSVIRKRIAERMIMSRRTSAHVHSVFEVDLTRVEEARRAKKTNLEAGARLTYLPFVIRAVVDALKAIPVVNASIEGDNIVYHRDANIGIAVALDWGLIVPVIKKADALDLIDLGRAAADLAARARSKQLKPDEVTGGTFTITNLGASGALFGLPIINQPQVAILCVGSVQKRPVVVGDAVAIRPMTYLTLGFDHRLIDGAVADQFLTHVKDSLENWSSVDRP